MSELKTAAEGRQRPLRTPTDLTSDATRDISAGLGALLADVFAVYLKTKNFHWHMSGPHFRDYVGSSRVDLQACKLEYSIVSPK